MKKILLIALLTAMLVLMTGCNSEKQESPQDSLNEQEEPNTNTEAPATNNAPEIEATGVKTTFYDPVPNTKDAVVVGATNTVQIQFRNNVPNTITLPLTGTWATYSKTQCKNYTISATYKGDAVVPLVTEIKSGDTFTILWDCVDPKTAAAGSVFDANLAFSYKNTANGMVKSHTGSLLGTYS